MKITKIQTKAGQFRVPVSTELSAVVERMRSPKTKEAADRIAAIALQSRLMMQQDAPRYFIEDSDRLPYLVFSATFGRSLSKPIAFTGLVLLNIPCPEGIRQVTELRRRVSQIPYTLLAFAGVSGVTLKVIVRCEYQSETLDADDYTAFLRDAHESAARLYTSLAKCNLLVGEARLTRGCRMSYDPQLYYQPEALVMPVVREAQDALQPYEGARADDSGTVAWYPDNEVMDRIELEYQVLPEGGARRGGVRGADAVHESLQVARHRPHPQGVPQHLQEDLRRQAVVTDEREGAYHAFDRGLPLAQI